MFTNPTALFALGLLALPVLIHMLARRSGPKLRFASTMFIPRSLAPRLTLMRVHRWPLLIMRLFVCGLFVLAISGPRFFSGGDDSVFALILIDASLSMNGEAIREDVVRQAREAIAALSERDRVAVARFDLSAQLLCDFTNDRSLIEQALDSYRPVYTESDFQAALSWAGERLREHPFRRRLILISDLQETGVAAMKPVELDGVDLRVLRIEQQPDQPNASLDAASVRSFGGRVDVTSALMMSRGSRTEIKPVSLRLDPVARDSETTASNESVSLSARLMDEGLIAGRLTTAVADALDADDNRFFVERLPVEATVLIVQPLATTGGHAGYIEKAMLAGLHLVSDINPVQVRETLPGSNDLLRRYRAVICPARSIDQGNLAAAREYARGGGSLIVLLGIEDSDLSEQLVEAAAIASLDQPEATGLLTPTVDDSPGSWAALRFRAARSVSAREGDVTLRYSNGEPAAMRVPVGGGSLMILGFGLSDKDTSLVRSPLFPQFVEWLVDASGQNASFNRYIAGHAPAAILLGGARRLTRIYSVEGGVRDEALPVNLEALYEPGIYRVERAAGETVFAINVPPSESRLAQSSVQQLVDRITVKNNSEPQTGEATGLWWIAAVAALALSLVELAWCSTRMQEGQNESARG